MASNLITPVFGGMEKAKLLRFTNLQPRKQPCLCFNRLTGVHLARSDLHGTFNVPFLCRAVKSMMESSKKGLWGARHLVPPGNRSRPRSVLKLLNLFLNRSNIAVLLIKNQGVSLVCLTIKGISAYRLIYTFWYTKEK